MPPGDGRRLELMDTTLRDGEQTPEVSYTPAEELQIARMLLRAAPAAPRERLPRGLVQRRARVVRLRLRHAAAPARARRRARLPGRHARRALAPGHDALRGPHDRDLARRPLRI